MSLNVDVYLLMDVSGSTVLQDVNTGCNLALPGIVDAVEAAAGGTGRICLMSYATGATVHVPLTEVAELMSLPDLVPGGLSSMAAGLRLLADTIASDLQQPPVRSADPVIIIVADGLPTDGAADLLAARDALDAALLCPARVHIVAPMDVDILALSGLRVSIHMLDTGDPRDLAEALVATVRRVTRPRC